MTMNKLPKLLKENGPDEEDTDDFYEREAFRNRCEFFKLKERHSSKEKFPYDAPMLAKWMLYYINKNEVSDEQ